MSYEEVIFYFVAALTVLGGLGVVLARNVVHSALFLILALLAVAAVFILLSAEFLALEELGDLLFRNWAVPFEVASLVLLVALVGAIILARGEEGE
jgi:NADH:ubiquinone oxidoreductase subunit 6 (subunit J)